MRHPFNIIVYFCLIACNALSRRLRRGALVNGCNIRRQDLCSASLENTTFNSKFSARLSVHCTVVSGRRIARWRTITDLNKTVNVSLWSVRNMDCPLANRHRAFTSVMDRYGPLVKEHRPAQYSPSGKIWSVRHTAHTVRHWLQLVRYINITSVRIWAVRHTAHNVRQWLKLVRYIKITSVIYIYGPLQYILAANAVGYRPL
jgi:hypothetical protein